MKKLILLLTSLTFCTMLFPMQDGDSIKNIQGNYIELSTGISTGEFRDIVTSPLFYTNLFQSININHKIYFKKNIITFKTKLYAGLSFKSIEDNFYSGFTGIHDFELSYLNNFDDYEYLKIRHWGGLYINNFTDYRVNQEFGNAAFTTDNISTIGLNYMFSKHWIRKKKEGKFLFLFKRTKKQKEYLFNFKIGIPIYSLIYRPGYTNPGNSMGSINIFKGYKVSGKVFSGFNSAISLSRILKNGNMIRFSYEHSIFTSGRKALNKLDFSQYNLLFSLIFKLN